MLSFGFGRGSEKSLTFKSVACSGGVIGAVSKLEGKNLAFIFGKEISELFVGERSICVTAGQTLLQSGTEQTHVPEPQVSHQRSPSPAPVQLIDRCFPLQLRQRISLTQSFAR